MQALMIRLGILVLAGALSAAGGCTSGSKDQAREGESAPASSNSSPAASSASQPGADARTVLVQMTPNGFSPNVLVLEYPVGTTVNVRVENQDSAPHGLRIRLGKQEFGLDQPVAPGASASFSFKMPDETGQGEYFSPVGEDRNRGFRGRAVPVVEAPGG